MKTIVYVLVVLLLPVIVSAANVKGHWRDKNRDGVKDTYVSPYQRTNPNTPRTDNYSYPGNFNPNTGRNTPASKSPRETYPSNPNPYEQKRAW